ncbi:DUF2339 domain-containing protein [Succinimonas amylolytica]|uniref:DUF2339 domain-containing protein n=1 Tax=Succinimonas amylolytica TaxID=83769 RepID=UPI0003796E75|nr:DUF2339 domain-containing protein [Succinimonas amylolytica]
MTRDNDAPEIIITPDEEGRIKTSVVGFIRGEFSETELLDFLARFKQEKIAAAAKKAQANAVPESPAPETAVTENYSESEVAGASENSVLDSVSESGTAVSDNTVNSAPGLRDGMETTAVSAASATVQKPFSSSENFVSPDSAAADSVWDPSSSAGSSGAAPSRNTWSASELITGKLLTGVGAALFLAIGFVLVARNVHFSMGPGFKFVVMLVFSLAAIVWGLLSGKHSSSSDWDFSVADVFRVTVSGIGFTLLYVVISLGCFYFDLLPPWLWRPFLLCWCLAMLGAAVYRHHIFTLLAQIGILVSFPIALDCLDGSLEGQVLLALLAQVPFHIYGVSRRQPVVCYNSVISFFILMCTLASGELNPDYGEGILFSSAHLMNLTAAVSGVIIGFLAIAGTTRRPGDSENTGFIRACSFVNILAFAGITVLCTLIIHFLFYTRPVMEAAFMLAVYAGDCYFIKRIRPLERESRIVRSFLSVMLNLWIVICLVAVPEVWILSFVLAVLHFVYGMVARSRAEIVPTAFFLTVFAVLYVSHDGLLFPESPTPVTWKVALALFLSGVFLYALIVRNRAECRLKVHNNSLAGTGPEHYCTATFRDFFFEDPDSGEKYLSTPAGLAFSKNCFTDQRAVRLVTAQPQEEAGTASFVKAVKESLPGQGTAALLGNSLPKAAVFTVLLIMLVGFVIGNGSLLMLHARASDFFRDYFIPGLMFVFAGLFFYSIMMLFRSRPQAASTTGKADGVFRTCGLWGQSLNRRTADLLTCLLSLLVLACGALRITSGEAAFSVSAVLLNTGFLAAGAVVLFMTFSGAVSRFGRGISSGSLVIPGSLYVLAVALGFSAGYFFHPAASWPFFTALLFAAVYDAVLPRLLRGLPEAGSKVKEFFPGAIARDELRGFGRGIHGFSIVLAVLFYFNCADYAALSSELGGSGWGAGLIFGCYTLLLGYFCFGDFFRKSLRCPDTISGAAVALTVFVTLVSYGLLRRGVIPTLLLYPLAMSFYVLWQRTGARFLRDLSLILISAAVFLMYLCYYHDLAPAAQKFFNTLHFVVLGQGIQSLVSGRNRSLRLLLLLGTVALPALICRVLDVKTWELFPMYWWLVLAAMVLFAVLRRDTLYIVSGIALVYLYSYRELSPVLREVFNTGSLIFLTLRILFAARVSVVTQALYTLGFLTAASLVAVSCRHSDSAAFPLFWELVLGLYAVLTCWNMKWNRVFYGLRPAWEDSWGVTEGSVNLRRGIYFLAGIVLVYFHYYHLMPHTGREIFNTFSIISGNLLLVLWFRKDPPVLRLSAFGLLVAAFLLSVILRDWHLSGTLEALAKGQLHWPSGVSLYPVLWGAVLVGYAVMAVVFRRSLYVLTGILLVYLVYYGEFSENWKILYNTGVYAAICLIASWYGEKDSVDHDKAPFGLPGSFLPVSGATLVFACYHLTFAKPWLFILPLLFTTIFGAARRDYVVFAGAMLLASFMTLAALWDIPGGGFAVAAVMMTVVMSVVLFAGARPLSRTAVPELLVPAMMSAVLGFVLAVAVLTLFYRHPVSVAVSGNADLLWERAPYFAVLALYSGTLLFIRKFPGVSDSSGSGVFRNEELKRGLGTAGIFATPGFSRTLIIMTLAVSCGGILGTFGSFSDSLAGEFWVLLMLTGCGAALLALIVMKIESGTDEDAASFDDCQRHQGLMRMTAESSAYCLRKIFYIVNFGFVCYATWFVLDILASRYQVMGLEIMLLAVCGVSLIYFLTAPLMFRSRHFRKFKIYYCMAKLFLLVYVIAALFRMEEGVTLTVSWLFVATLLLFFGFFFNIGEIRKTGLVVCMLCVVKLLLWDLSYHGDIAKALSYLLAGVILLGASFVYNYFSRRISREAGE